MVVAGIVVGAANHIMGVATHIKVVIHIAEGEIINTIAKEGNWRKGSFVGVVGIVVAEEVC